MKKLFFGLIVIVTLLVSGLAYLGVVPFISPLITKPRDLGVKADPSLVVAFEEANEMKNELPNGVVPEGREPEYSGNKTLNVEINNAEITSIFSYWKNQYNKMPIKDVQVKINDDGTGEASGILEVSTAIMMAKQLNYSDEDIEKGKSYVQYVAGDLPFYIKGVASVSNNKVSMSPSEIIIGRVTLPESLVSPVAKVSSDVIERRMNQIPGLNVKELTLENGAIHLVADVPDTIK